MSMVLRLFWWCTLTRDVKEFVTACHICAQSKPSRRPPAGLLRPLPVPHRPWSHVAMDFSTGLPESNSYSVLLTIVDRFSKMTHLVPLKKLPTAKELSTVIAREVFHLHGLPCDIVSDRGPQFISKFWGEFNNLLGINRSLSSDFHPQTDGQAERANQKIETKLRGLCQRDPSKWSENLPWIEYALNCLPSFSTNLSPLCCLWLPASCFFPSGEGGHRPLCSCSSPALPTCVENGLEGSTTFHCCVLLQCKLPPRHQPTRRGRGCGSLPRNSLSRWRVVVSLPRDLLVPCPFPKSLILLLFASTSHTPCASTPRSMCHGSSHFISVVLVPKGAGIT
uniref:Gypsy retrotransposon integrase-like protein 1 n=1 Tax=Nothobranchius furzeri TaxID=105023 RepID=A0A8C6PF46_NOTFU